MKPEFCDMQAIEEAHRVHVSPCTWYARFLHGEGAPRCACKNPLIHPERLREIELGQEVEGVVHTHFRQTVGACPTCQGDHQPGTLRFLHPGVGWFCQPCHEKGKEHDEHHQEDSAGDRS